MAELSRCRKRILSVQALCGLIAFGLIAPTWQLAQAQTDSAAQRPAQVVLRVLDDAGKPIRDASVKAFQWTGQMLPDSHTTITPDGEQLIIGNIDTNTMVYLTIGASKYATSQLPLVGLSPGENRKIDFKLSPATESWVEIIEPLGRPIEGAQIAVLDFVDANKSNVYISYSTAHCMNYQFMPSDASGRLRLPPLPAGAQISLTVVHPDWQLGYMSPQEISAGLLTRLTLRSGIKIVCGFAPRPDQPALAEGEMIHVTMSASERRRDDPKDIRFAFPVRQQAIAFTASPVEYEYLRLKCESHFIALPIYNRLGSPDARLQLQNLPAGSTTRFDFTTLTKMKVRGRVIDAQGQGIAGVTVSGSVGGIENAAFPSEVVVKDRAKYAREWLDGGDMNTSSNGGFEIEMASGRATIELIAEGYFSDPTIHELLIPAGQSEFRLSDYTLHAVPELHGRVVSADGAPVADAYVRMRHKGYGDADPVGITDADGNFSLSLSRVPYSANWGLQTDVAVMALDTASDSAGLAAVDLKDTTACNQIRIQVSKQEPGWLIEAVPPYRFLSAEDERELLDKQRQKFSAGNTGQRVPDLTSGTWLNTSAKSLEDFRGQLVLMDFWFIGCGPCERDQPSLIMLQRQLAKRGFTIISVHNDSQSVESVKAFAEQKGMNYPIVVDTDGSIIKQYASLGLEGYPHYILLDRDGRILFNDATSGITPDLRSYKVEMIYEALRAK